MHVPALCLLDVWSTAGFSTLNSAILLQMYAILWFEAHGYCFGRCVFEPIPSRSTSQPSQRSYDLPLHSNCILIRHGGGETSHAFPQPRGASLISLDVENPSEPLLCVSPFFLTKSFPNPITTESQMLGGWSLTQDIFCWKFMDSLPCCVKSTRSSNLHYKIWIKHMDSCEWKHDLCQSEHPWWKHNKTLDFGTWNDALHPCILFIFFSAAFWSEIFRASHFLTPCVSGYSFLPGP